MNNTKIHLTFVNGQTREYRVNDEVERQIINGKPFIIETMHPEFGEACYVKIGVELTNDALDTGDLVNDSLYKALDELYKRGWEDRHKEQDYDPRGTVEWQTILDLFRLQKSES